MIRFFGNLAGFFFAMIFRPSASIKIVLEVSERSEIKDLKSIAVPGSTDKPQPIDTTSNFSREFLTSEIQHEFGRC